NVHGPVVASSVNVPLFRSNLPVTLSMPPVRASFPTAAKPNEPPRFNVALPKSIVPLLFQAPAKVREVPPLPSISPALLQDELLMFGEAPLLACPFPLASLLKF